MLPASPTHGETARRGFSLIELMIVIVIIAIVVALVVPALGTARAVAKDADTRSLMSSLAQASSQFQLDNRRIPGYFSAVEMAHADNGEGGEGFSGMQNAMLDLAGGVSTTLPGGGLGVDEVVVGPSGTASKNVVVNLAALGTTATGKAYFLPAAKYFKKQDGTDGGPRGADASGVSAASAGNQAFPELVDTNGQPLLWWATNPQAVGPINSISDFASDNFSPGSTARVYWNQNAVFCSSARTGRQLTDNFTNSLISSGNGNKLVTLTALMGNPNSPNDPNLGNRAAVLPTAARGSVVIHAAGRDGVYLNGAKGRGSAAAGGVTGAIFYGGNFFSDATTRRLDADNKRTSVDVLADFDDFITAID